MKFGFTSDRAASSTSTGNSSRSTRKLRKRSSLKVAEAAQNVSLTTDSVSTAPAPVPVPVPSESPSSKFDVYTVPWRHLRIDSDTLRNMAVSTCGSAVDSLVDEPELLLRSLLESCSEPELMYVSAMLGMEQIRNDKEALIVEIIKTMSTKKQRSFGSMQLQTGSIVSVSPKKRVGMKSDEKM